MHPALEQLAGQSFARIVNIGCADGYYAIGFARRMAGTPVVAFDTNVEMQQVTRQAARLNHVEGQVQVAGECTLGGARWMRSGNQSS